MQYLCLVNRPQKVLWKVTKYIHFYPAFRGVLAYVPPFVCRTLSDNAVQLKIWSTYLCTTWFSIWGLWIINTTQNVCFPIDVSYVTQHYNTTSTWHTFVFGRLVYCRRESKWPYSLDQNVALSNVSENLKMDEMEINQHDNITINYKF